MQCNKFIVEHQKAYLDRKVSAIKSAHEREKMTNNILDFMLVD